jgi:hypothetical protein
MNNKKFNLLTLITMLPVLLWPVMMTRVDHIDTGTERFLMLAMPVFAIAVGYLAHYTHRDRPEVSWVLLIVAWLSYLAFAVLVYA